MVVSGPPQSPRTGLALTDLQQSTSVSVVSPLDTTTNSSSGNGVGGGLISGLAIASNNSGNWSTRGVGGIGAGLSCSTAIASSSSFGGLFGMKIGVGGGSGGLHSTGSSQGSFGSDSGFSSTNGTTSACGIGGAGGGGGLFNNCGCSSSDYGLFKK